MRICWITDNKLGDSRFGGAEITNDYMIKEGIKRGHFIEIISPRDCNKMCVFSAKYDLFILNNIFDFNYFLFDLIKGTSYMFYHHDYNFCVYRNADCEKYKCNMCENSKAYMEYSSLFQKAKLNIFLSPLHQKLTENKIPGLTSMVIPVPLDLKLFKDYGKARKHDYIYFGNIYLGKGILETIHKYKNVHFYGRVWDKKLIKEIESMGHKYLGSVKYEDMPKILNKYKYFIRGTVLKESFGRSTIEAKACGCEVLSNTIIGVDSFDLTDKELLNQCGTAPKTFWDKVEAL